MFTLAISLRTNEKGTIFLFFAKKCHSDRFLFLAKKSLFVYPGRIGNQSSQGELQNERKNKYKETKIKDKSKNERKTETLKETEAVKD